MDQQYKKFADERIQQILLCCDYAIDAEAVRANQAEMRLASVRDTLAAVRVQHELIYRKYEDLARYNQELERRFEELKQRLDQKSGTTPRHLDFDTSRENISTSSNHSDSVVKRMRAQLEANSGNSLKTTLGVTPVAKRTRTTVQITKSFA